MNRLSALALGAGALILLLAAPTLAEEARHAPRKVFQASQPKARETQDILQRQAPRAGKASAHEDRDRDDRDDARPEGKRRDRD